MGTSKILIDGVGIDLTADTVAANKLLSGYTAHDSSGDSITGSIHTYTGTQASGVKSITENGTYDVTEFASAAVLVPTPPEKQRVKSWRVNVPTAVAAQYVTVLTGDSDVATHYADDSAVCTIIKLNNLNNNGTHILVTKNKSEANENAITSMLCGWDATGASANATSIHRLSVEVDASTGAGYCITATATGAIKVAAGRTKVNFGGADYLVIFAW